MILEIDEAASVARITEGDTVHTLSLGTPEWFAFVSKLWLRAGWDAKYVYSFSWLGRPIIQLPDDMFRLQEVIYRIRPDVLIETGVAHGGSLVFYAGLFAAMGKGRVVGIDIDIRSHNRKSIEGHELSRYITLLEGSSIDESVVERARVEVKPADTVLVVLDSNHTKAHVRTELEFYAPLVSVGSYIVATDGIMGDLVGAPRAQADWGWNNPKDAAMEFVAAHDDYSIEEPQPPFNEGTIADRVTYWPNAYIRRVR